VIRDAELRMDGKEGGSDEDFERGKLFYSPSLPHPRLNGTFFSATV
jgi:hypothetical protein